MSKKAKSPAASTEQTAHSLQPVASFESGGHVESLVIDPATGFLDLEVSGQEPKLVTPTQALVWLRRCHDAGAFVTDRTFSDAGMAQFYTRILTGGGVR